jgi:nitroreductase
LTTPDDPYQKRYQDHQERKSAVLAELLAERHSERRFANENVPDDDLARLMDAAERSASSCARHGVYMSVVNDRDTKALLGGLLVGGVGWIHRAPTVIMLFADPVAYKAGDEITYMPYLDAGVMVGHLYLAAASLGLAGCFVNPNVRTAHQDLFRTRFGYDLYCGAYAVGPPRADDTRHGAPEQVGLGVGTSCPDDPPCHV